jgi:biopolymer transport protein ExbD
LITFFILVTNFNSVEMDLSLKLPVVGSARPVETNGQQGLLVLNIDRQGELKIYGRMIQDVESFISKEASARRMGARIQSGDNEAVQDLPTTVVIRADRATSFKMLNRVIKACQDNGFRKFALKALEKEA